MADALGVHVLDSLQDLLDQPGDLNLGDVLVGGDDVKELATSGKLADQGHAILVVVNLDQPGNTKKSNYNK